MVVTEMEKENLTDVQKKELFVEKHKPLTPEEVKKKNIDADAAIKRYEKDIALAEANLVDYLNRQDPLVDPARDVAVAWLRRLPYAELKNMIPDELQEAYRSGDPDTFLNEADEFEDYIFTLMEKIIAIPEKTAEEWKDTVNLNFIELFNARLEELMGRLEEQTSFF